MTHDHKDMQSHSGSTDADRKEPDMLDRFVRHWGVTAIMIGIVVFYLVTEHRAHFFGALPWLILLACPFLHMFMHGAPGGHDKTKGNDRDGGQ